MNIGAANTVVPALLAGLACWFAGIGWADADGAGEPLPDKSRYTLFNPTPRWAMRELEADRPDKTESAYTVDAGHLQLEMDFARFTLHHEKGVRSQKWNVAPVNFKIGLLNNVDIEFLYDDYINLRTKNQDPWWDPVTTQSGFGDLTPRLKINLWGNDGGPTAFSILPFLKIPTNTGHVGNNAVEGGLLLPFAAKLPAGWDLGLEANVSFLRNENNGGRHVEFASMATVSHEIVGKLDGYVEFFNSVSTERGAGWVATVDFGLTYELTKDIRLDAGVNLGVTPAADAVEPFTGLTVRY
jgi:hypothetical protein